MRGQNRTAGLYVVALSVAGALASGSGVSARQARGVIPNCTAPLGSIVMPSCGDAVALPDASKIDPVEHAAYDAFAEQDNIDAKIHLGEDFDQKYPHSAYENSVDTGLTSLYYNRQDWAKFYAIGEKTIAKNPKNLAILELVGWAIPHNSNLDPAAAAKLDEAKNYEKRAIELIAAMKKGKEVTQADFDASIAGLAWRAHSGLGLAYLREKDYADSAAELQIAVKDEAVDVDAGDLYALGIALENLDRKGEAVDAFTKCGQISGDIQEACQEALQKATAELKASPEETAFEAFRGATNSDTQIQLGEHFDQTYPSSGYEEHVDTILANLYQSKQDLQKFYATADKVLAKDPDNVSILTLVGWTIPHVYDANDPDASAKLDEAEKDETHALAVLAAMQKPGDLTQEQFDRAKTSAALQAHSGLGITYFRRTDYADSARELEFSTADPAQADAFDLYVLGIDQEKLGRTIQALGAFSQCASIAGGIQAQCKSDADALVMRSGPAAASSAVQPRSNAGAELAAVAAKPSSPSSALPSPDIPRATETGPTIKAETVLVPVRVVVRDTKGRAVADLKKEDFKLYQDGKRVEISSFTAINLGADSHGLAAAAANGSVNQASSATNAPSAAAPVASPTQFVALFFDDLHLYFSDMAQVRDAARKFLATLHPEDRVAIVTASGVRGLDFTSDRGALETAMGKLQIHTFPGATGAVAHAGGPCPPPMTYTEAHAIDYYASGPVAAIADGDFVRCMMGGGGAGMALAGAEAEAASAAVRGAAARTEIAGEEATDAVFKGLQGAVSRLSSLPGRRIVAMVSPGFVYSGHQKDFAEIVNLALRYSVVINTLDAKGIYEVGFTDLHAPPGTVAGGEGKWDPDRFQQFGFSHFLSEQPILEDLADATGGRFVKNNNDFAGVLREFGEAPEVYYLLSYTPQNLAADGKYHALKVSLARRSFDSVQARKGFYAPSGTETPEQASTREMEDALFSDEQQHDLAVKMETSLAVAADGSNGRKLNVVADLDVANMRFVKQDGANEEEVVLDAAVFDKDGNYVTGTKKTVSMKYDDNALAQLEKTGAKVNFDFDVKPGEYTVRMVARDSNDGHIAAESAAVSVKE